MPSGTSWSSKVRVAAYTGETVWMTPLVHGSGNPGAVIRFSAGGEHYIEFDGINMDGRNVMYGTVGFVIDAASEPHHVRVQNAEVIGRSTDNSAYSGYAAHCIEIHGGRKPMVGGFEFRNLKVHGGGRPGTGTFAHNGYGFYIAGPNNLIENNDIYDNRGAAIHVFNDDGASPDNNIIRNNRIHDETRNANIGQLWGILLLGSNNQVYNNCIYRVRAEPGTNPGGQGLAIEGTGNSVWNNTIFDIASEGLTIAARSTSTVVRNNILYGNGINFADAGSGTIRDHNIDNGTNPLFTDAAAGNFTLQAGSPARNAGTAIGQVTTDIIGASRPNESVYDIGAYEYGATSITAPPPVAASAPAVAGRAGG
jgi:hypothetical protein